jgi:prepilin-type N-terminal cleavage/methylation domain-containing protein
MKPNSSRITHPAGFTLVELLVTITIIVVLAALTFMGSSAFLKRAAAVKDMSNMKNLWTAINLYAGDNNDTLPGPLNAGQKAIYGANARTVISLRRWHPVGKRHLRPRPLLVIIFGLMSPQMSGL